MPTNSRLHGRSGEVPPGLDDVDLALLRALQADARTTQAALGQAVGLTGPSVYARIRRLERDGVIRGYTTLVDPQAVGQDLVAFVRVGTQAGPGEQQPFESFVLAEDQIVECYDVDGEDSYILKVRTASPQTLRDLLARLRAIPGVTRSVTSIALAGVKDLTRTGHVTGPGDPGEPS